MTVSLPTPWLRTGAVLGLLVVGEAVPLRAQDDVVMAGLRHGTRPPATYFELRRRDPTAFRFSRAWMNRNPRLRVEERSDGPPTTRVVGEGVEPPIARSTTGPAGGIGPRPGGVSGRLDFPLVLGFFADDAGVPSVSDQTIQTQFFDGPNDRAGTLAEYWAEASGGALDLRGVTHPWVRSSLTRQEVTAGVSGLGGSSQVGGFILSILSNLDDGSVDWGQYDNDGPDGIPNSGDDDGFVDVLGVLHPTAGAECSGAGDRIWSHHWTLWSAVGAPYETQSPAAGGGVIRVNDYTVQALRDCDGVDVNTIGVFAHELGHGLGLPDLYCTGSSCAAAGIGEWGLMGSGGWGCNGSDASRPCHLSAWSRSVLGWATVETVPPGADPSDFLLQPVRTSGRVLRYDLPGTSEFYLLENRQPGGFDANLHASGLLVWLVDQERVDEQWAANRVNADPTRFGVSLVQADNSRHLEGTSGNRGDAGDVFPGSSGRTAFHAGTAPAATGRKGVVSGLTLTGLGQAGPDLSFSLGTRLHAVALSTSGDGGTQPLLSVDGVDLPVGGDTVRGAPYQRLRIQAASGEVTSAGVRTPFTTWDDGVASPDRDFEVGAADTAFVARYSGQEFQVGVTLEGGRFGVDPGAIASEPVSPGLWFEGGSAVTLTAEAATGFAFEAWTGALEGAPNPVGLVVDAPVEAGATFSFVFQVPDPERFTVTAGDPLSVLLSANNASEPVQWELIDGRLPVGVVFRASGGLAGEAIELGSFAFTVRARDAAGLEGTATVSMDVAVPELPLAALASDWLLGDVGPTAAQVLYLDYSGNRNGALDLGDVRAHLVRAAAGPTVPPAPATVERVLVVRVGEGR